MKRKFIKTSSFNLDEIVSELSTILEHNFKKPIIQQNNNIIFNVFLSVNKTTLDKLSYVNYVKNINIYCNQFSLNVEVQLTETLLQKRKKTEFNIASIMNLENKIKFFPPEISKLSFTDENDYYVLNDILKVSLFTLFADDCSVKRSVYKIKKPYYIIIIELADNKCEHATLSNIIEASKQIKDLSVRFDTQVKTIKIVIKVCL